MWNKTSDNQDFVLDQNVGLVIFCSLKNQQFLQKSQNILCDGTFKSAPKPFRQIYTLFSVVQDYWSNIGVISRNLYKNERKFYMSIMHNLFNSKIFRNIWI